MTLPYEQWECFKAGLYKTQCDDWENLMINACDLLASVEIEQSMQYIIDTWHTSRNHYFAQSEGTWRPWMGHAACCFELGVPNWVTKKAWHLLTFDQQAQANGIARKIYGEWHAQDLLV